MNRLLFRLYAGAVSSAIAIPFPATVIASTEKVLHSFGSGADGSNPLASLIDVNDTLYGTTYEGGTGSCMLYGVVVGCGTVFSVNPKTGAETVVYSFSGGADGAFAGASLIDVKGTLYGITYKGGTHDEGTVFAVNPKTGAKTRVYSFLGGTDGNHPEASLIDLNGKLYGTTYEGGAHGDGTVFSVDPETGAETVLYSFGGSPDGADLTAGLIDVKGALYGTTVEGGADRVGTVFSVNPATGAETVLHTFGNGIDAADPWAGLINAKRRLYGTTVEGGTHAGGTVFSINPKTGAETVVYSFCSQQNCTDGWGPYASLIDVKGALYGTTEFGGPNLYGTVFSVSPTAGTETVVYSFSGGADGGLPGAGLIDVKGALYGTTFKGGTYGRGTVFVLKP
jgi:uncharacterized repeat protein (TIGR03803 family)